MPQPSRPRESTRQGCCFPKGEENSAQTGNFPPQTNSAGCSRTPGPDSGPCPVSRITFPNNPGTCSSRAKGINPVLCIPTSCKKQWLGGTPLCLAWRGTCLGRAGWGVTAHKLPITSVFFWMLEHPSRPPIAPSSQKGRVRVPRPRSRGPTPSSRLDSCSVRPEPEPMLGQAWLCDLPAPGALLAMPDPWTPLSPQGLGQENGPGCQSSPELASAEGSAARLVVSSLARVQPQTPISQLALSFQLKLPVSYHFHSLPLQQCRKLALNSPCEAAWWQLN